MDIVSHASPRRLARIGGLLYLIIIVLGLFGEMVVRAKIVVPGDAPATAANLRSMESLWRLGLASEFVMLISATALLPILYVLLRPVSRWLAGMAVAFDIVSIGVQAVGVMHLWAALFPLGAADYLRAFPPAQLDTLATLSIRWHTHGFGVALLFFGCFCVIAGYLIYKSGYMPRWVGLLMQLAGAAYLVNSFALILAPAVASRLYPVILLPPFVGELSLCVWLLVKGVNEEKWKARAAQ